MDVDTFIGLVYEKKQRKLQQKVVTLDLDETIGSFAHLHILWTGILKSQVNTSFTKLPHFFQVFDLFPEFLRDHIFEILIFLYNQRKNNKNTKLFLYTNNQCDYPWTENIIKYLEHKLGIAENLFDHTIGAFKIRNRVIEPNRTTFKKTYDDFIRCTMLPKSTEICFIDDSYHQQMIHDKVYYIQPRAYYHNLQLKTVIQRFILSDIGFQIRNNSILKDNFVSYLHDWFEFNNASRYIHHNYNPINAYKTTQKIMFHIREFFHSKKHANTRRSRPTMSNFTRKVRPRSRLK